MGVNDSVIHVDFMIGAPDLQIEGISRDGKKYTIFQDGNWSI
jgi:aminopeptidase